jgi:hypothetical protein
MVNRLLTISIKVNSVPIGCLRAVLKRGLPMKTRAKRFDLIAWLFGGGHSNTGSGG